MELDRLLKLLVEKYIRSGKKSEKAQELESTGEKQGNAEMPNAVPDGVRKEEGSNNNREPMDRQP